MGPHIDPGFSNSIEIGVFAAVGMYVAYRLKRLEEALLVFAGRASRPLPSVAAPVAQELSTPPTVHIPSSLEPWEPISAEDE